MKIIIEMEDGTKEEKEIVYFSISENMATLGFYRKGIGLSVFKADLLIHGQTKQGNYKEITIKP